MAEIEDVAFYSDDRYEQEGESQKERVKLMEELLDRRLGELHTEREKVADLSIKLQSREMELMEVQGEALKAER